MTISPPAKVKSGCEEAGRVLASGFDSLVVFVQVVWRSESFLERLGKARVQAETYGVPWPDEIKYGDGQGAWVFNVQPHGRRGYAYLLVANELTMKVGNWLRPQQRPSVLVELRSEYLWTVGPQAAVARVRDLIAGAGGQVEHVGVTRVDPCVDVLLRDSVWRRDLEEEFVTRAVDIAPWSKHRQLSGFSVGKGDMCARLYDKPLEIKTASKKEWMFDVWSVGGVPEGHRITRVEFQIRRQVLKELGILTPDDLFRLGGNLWAYCSQEWLKVQDNPGMHHTQRHTVPWWSVVQSGFAGSQGACPLVRAKALAVERRQLLGGLFGNLESLLAVESQGRDLEEGDLIELDRQIVNLLDGAAEIGLTDEKLTRRVREKWAKYQRCMVKAEKAAGARRAFLISCGSNRQLEGSP